MLGGVNMARRKFKALPEREKQSPEVKKGCKHYWVIESPTGPSSMGRCKICGAVSEFSNYAPYPMWESRTLRSAEESIPSNAE